MKLFGIGPPGRDVEIHTWRAASRLPSLALAYDYGMKDENGKKKPTQWVSASLWGDQAGRLQQYFDYRELRCLSPCATVLSSRATATTDLEARRHRRGCRVRTEAARQ